MDIRASGFWTTQIANMLQNTRFILAILASLHTFSPQAKEKAVQVLTKMSPLCSVSTTWEAPVPYYHLCHQVNMAVAQEYRIELTAAFLTGWQNVEADWLSHPLMHYEWRLNLNSYWRESGDHTCWLLCIFW